MRFSRLPLLWRVFAINATLLVVATLVLVVARSRVHASLAFLEGLERGAQAAPMAVNPAFASLYSANPLPRAGLAALFSTHPPIPERVRRLHGYDAALAPQAA